MSATVGALNINAPLGTEVTMREGSGRSALLEFERIYRDNVGVVTAFFARRCSNPQTVADLTSETIVRAAAVHPLLALAVIMMRERKMRVAIAKPFAYRDAFGIERVGDAAD